MSVQVPAVCPFAMVQIPVQQSPPLYYLDLDMGSFTPRQENALEPLFQITQLLGGGWTSKLYKAVDRLFLGRISRQDLVYRTHVLADIREVFEDSQAERLSTERRPRETSLELGRHSEVRGLVLDRTQVRLRVAHRHVLPGGSRLRTRQTFVSTSSINVASAATN